MTSEFSYDIIRHYYEELIHYSWQELEQMRNDIDATEDFFKIQDQKLNDLVSKDKKNEEDVSKIKALKENLDSVQDIRDSNEAKKYVIEEFIAKDLEPVPPSTISSAIASAVAMQHAAAIASSIHGAKKEAEPSKVTKSEAVSEKELCNVHVKF